MLSLSVTSILPLWEAMGILTAALLMGSRGSPFPSMGRFFKKKIADAIQPSEGRDMLTHTAMWTDLRKIIQ